MSDDEEAAGARVIPISERVLFERYRRGEREAFEPLLSAWRARVYGYLTRCGVPPAERDDLFQEVFLRVHRAASATARSDEDAADEGAADVAVPDSGSLAPWVLTITVNVVRSHFRKVGVRSVVVLDGEAAAEAASPAQGPESALDARREAAWIERAIQALPLEQREALVLCAIEGMEVREAAEVLGASFDTIKTRLRRARLALAEARARSARIAAREEA